MLKHAVLLSLFFSSTAAASGLDVTPWLERPGVRLVAVEFYATWCKPCMKAVPKWKALHEKYRRQGFRLIVVATQDPDGGCQNPGWNPDEVVCDDDGTIAASFGASKSLPAAFLWDWQGKLLVRKGHVEEVESAVNKWMRQSVRVSVEIGKLGPNAEIDKTSLRNLVRSKLQDYGKISVVATEEEQREIERLKLSNLNTRYDNEAACEIGFELPPTSLLKAQITGQRDRTRLFLQLLNLESGCLLASSVVDWGGRNSSLAVSEGVAELTQKLRGPMQRPVVKSGELRFSGSVQIQVPKIILPPSDGDSSLKEINLKVERKLETAEETNENPKATPEQKFAAWCSLAEVRSRNAYQSAADQACEKWRLYAYKYRKQEQTLAQDYGILSGYLSLRRKNKKQKLAVVNEFLRAHGTAKHPLVTDVRMLKKKISRGADISIESLADKYEPGCKKNLPAACRMLGLAAEHGLWPRDEPDMVTAERYYSTACTANFGPGCTHLGLLLEGRSQPGQAKSYFAKACEFADASSCRRRADQLSKSGQAQEALVLYSKACQLEDVSSCSRAAQLAKSVDSAGMDFQVIKKACLLGDPKLCLTAAIIYEKGDQNVPKDERRAEAFYQKACDGDVFQACGLLGKRRNSGKLLRRACLGKAYSFCYPAALAIQKNVPKDAMALMKMGCKHDQVEACRTLAVAISKDSRLATQPGEATRYHQRACELKNAKSCVSAAKQYLSGVDVTQDRALGLKYLVSACRLGRDQSCKKAAELTNADTSMTGGELASLFILAAATISGALGGWNAVAVQNKTEMIKTGGFATADDIENLASDASANASLSSVFYLSSAGAALAGTILWFASGPASVTAEDIRNGD